jgi:hypothetical protein
MSQGVEESRLEQFRDIVGIGSSEFIERIKKRAGDGGRETERRGRLRERVVFKDAVHAVETITGESAGNWLHLHGDWRKWKVPKLARQYIGFTLSQHGEEMKKMDYAAVGMGLRRLRRFEQRLNKDRSLEKAYRQAVQMLDVKT